MPKRQTAGIACQVSIFIYTRRVYLIYERRTANPSNGKVGLFVFAWILNTPDRMSLWPTVSPSDFTQVRFVACVSLRLIETGNHLTSIARDAVGFSWAE